MCYFTALEQRLASSLFLPVFRPVTLFHGSPNVLYFIVVYLTITFLVLSHQNTGKDIKQITRKS